MKSFEDFFIHLIEDERFYENASRNHRKETVESTARKIYEVATVDRDMFEITSIAEHRKHLLFKLYKIPADKVKKSWHEIALEEREKEKKASEPEWVPLEGEAREKRLAEFMAAHLACELPKRVAPLSARERIEGDDLRPKPEAIREPSQEEKIKAAREHTELMQKARVKMFREKFPDGTPKQLRDYLKKFKSIDNPFNL